MTRRPDVNVMENVDQPPDQTPFEREAEERWVEGQYRKTCPWRIRLAKWVIRKIGRKP